MLLLAYLYSVLLTSEFYILLFPTGKFGIKECEAFCV